MLGFLQYIYKSCLVHIGETLWLSGSNIKCAKSTNRPRGLAPQAKDNLFYKMVCTMYCNCRLRAPD
jgi:hypothetical protein